jgi:TatA/E family protein of Tat protein translocase
MGGFSIMHLLLLTVILLVFFGPSRLPSLGKSIGEAIRGFKQGIDGTGDIDVTNTAKREQIPHQEQATADEKSKTSSTTDTKKNS